MTMCEYSENITVSIPSIDRIVSVRPILDYMPAGGTKPKPVNESQKLYYDGDRLLSEVNYPTTKIAGKQPLFTITMVVSTDRILSDMRHFFSEDFGNTLLMDGSNTWSLCTEDTAPAPLLQYFTENAGSLRELVTGLVRVKLDGEVSWAIFRYSEPMNAFLINYRPESLITKMLASTNLTIWVLSAFTILMILFSIFWIRRFFDQPMSNLMNALGRVEKGDLKMNIDYEGDNEFHYLYDQFNRMLTELNRQIEQNYANRIRTQQAELKQLQYHIKPHFLYNSIFLIYRMAVDGDMESIQDFSLTLGNYYRYITRIQSDTIPLEREVDHIKSYVKIQTTRFGERIAVRMDEIPEGMESKGVPPLILQPVVENAYHHGVSMMESGGRIQIAMQSADGYLLITIDDNGPGMSEDALQGLSFRMLEDDVSEASTGLSNVHHRLRIHFGGESGLRLSHSPLGGLRVILAMKLEQERKHD
jgi:two-component system sensor histidine kinase YesM